MPTSKASQTKTASLKGKIDERTSVIIGDSIIKDFQCIKSAKAAAQAISWNYNTGYLNAMRERFSTIEVPLTINKQSSNLANITRVYNRFYVVNDVVKYVLK